MANWGDLPSVILLEIMRYLNKRDRLSCGVVCKHWYATMCNPQVWKNLCILLDADLTDPLTMVVVRRYAQHITSLDISWSRPFLPRRWIRSRLTTVAHDTMNFLTHLKECNLELISFKLNDWYFTWKYKKVICNLSTLLKNQRKLQFIDLSNAFLNKNDILKILKGCENSRLTIKFISLLGSFHEWHNVALNPTFAILMQQFINLEILKLDYSSFSDNVLNSFIENNNKSLKYIEIHLKESDNRSHVMSSTLWKKIKRQCKNLKVGLHICNICHYADIYYMLIDAIPLQTFILNCPNIWDMTRSRSYCGTLNLLLFNYEDTLTRVILNLRNNREIIDESLFELIRRCKMLEYLEFDGVLQNVDFIKDVCELQCDLNDYAYKYFHVRPRNASLSHNLKLGDIWRSYVTPLKQNDIRFEVETLNNPTVRIYC